MDSREARWFHLHHIQQYPFRGWPCRVLLLRAVWTRKRGRAPSHAMSHFCIFFLFLLLITDIIFFPFLLHYSFALYFRTANFYFFLTRISHKWDFSDTQLLCWVLRTQVTLCQALKTFRCNNRITEDITNPDNPTGLSTDAYVHKLLTGWLPNILCLNFIRL